MEYYGQPTGGGGAGSAATIQAFYPLGPGAITTGTIPANLWRSRQASQNPGFGHAEIGMGGVTQVWDAADLCRLINVPAGAAGSLFAITGHSVAMTPPVRPVGGQEAGYRALSIWRFTCKWSAATPYGGANNGTILGWCWQPAAGSIFPAPQDIYRYAGFMRDSTGTYLAYRNAGAKVVIPFAWNVTANNRFEMRFRAATGTEPGKMEWVLNGLTVLQRTWSDPDMPVTAAANEYWCPVIMRYGTPAIPALNIRDMEIIIGPDVPISDLAP